MTGHAPGVGCPTSSRWRQGEPGLQGASFLPLPRFNSLPQEVAENLTSGQRRRLLADANAAVRGLNYLHGEGHRGSVTATASAATCEKVQWLQRDVLQRVLSCALRWIDVDSAIDETEALAKLLKGKDGNAPAASTSVGSYEYSRVSLPESVMDAPSVNSMLPAEARISSRSSSHGCCSRPRKQI